MSLPSKLPDHVGDEEEIARFLTSSGHFNTKGPKPNAFMPNPKNGETSVFRHGAEPLEELKEIAQKEVGAERNIYGAAIFRAGVVRRAELEIRAKEPPPRHADIIEWPLRDAVLDKARCKELALAMSSQAESVHF